MWVAKVVITLGAQVNAAKRPKSVAAMAWARPSLLVVLAVALTLAACNQGPGPDSVADAAPVERDVWTVDSATPEDVESESSPVGPQCVLTPAHATPVVVRAGGTAALGVYQHEIDSGAPTEGYRVAFQVVEEQSATGRLSVSNASLDQEGYGAFRLSAGETAGSLVVRVSSDCATTIDLEIEVTP